MKILNSDLENDLAKSNTIKLDLGCGLNPRKGFYALDHLEMEGIDIVADLNKPLSLLPDNCCDYIYSNHVFEHIQEFLPLMCEIYRIAKPNASIEIVVPHFSNVYAYSDPTHVRFFGLYSMYYFASIDNQPPSRKVPSFYTDIRFEITSIKIEFMKRSRLDKLIAPIFMKFVNKNIHIQDFYERRLVNFFHAQQIRYLLKPEKENKS